MGGGGAPPTGSAPADDMTSISGIRRPSSFNAASATPAAAAPGKPLEAHLARDDKGKSPASAFPGATPKIYLAWTDGTATKGTKLRVVWIVDDAGAKFSKHKTLYENTMTLPGPVAGVFYLPAGGKLPPGKYHVQLFEDGKLAKTMLFTVTA
jgi:hypothetical protein